MSNASEAEFGKNTSPEAMKKMLEAEGIVFPTFDKDQLRKLISHFTEDELRRYLFNALQPDTVDEDETTGFLPDEELEQLQRDWQFFENLRAFNVDVEISVKYPINFIINPDGQIVSGYNGFIYVRDFCNLNEEVTNSIAVQERLRNLNTQYREFCNRIRELAVEHDMTEQEIWALVK